MAFVFLLCEIILALRQRCKTYLMKQLIFLLAVNSMIITANGQSTPPPNLPKDAKVEGSIVNMNDKAPLNNELIVFRSKKNTNEYQAISDASGKFSTRLPAGDQYDIYVMGFQDSSSYNVLDIPA